MSDIKLTTEGGETIHLPCYMTGFLLDIERMNGMYRMPEVADSWAVMVKRLKDFQSILEEECTEIQDVANFTVNEASDTAWPEVKLETRVKLSDLLGDIIVYCASEAKRWNIPIDRVLNIIMQSNFSKLDSNGQPIYDERMKLQKGPNYWKPEPKIAALLKELSDGY